MELSPYSWQTEAVDAWQRAGHRGIADVVTGAGKTYFAMLAIQSLQKQLDVPLHVFVVVPTCELQNQWRKKFREFFPGEHRVGLIGAGRHDSVDLKFQIYVVNTARVCLADRRNQLLSRGEAVLLIADECHHYGATENRKIFSKLPTGKHHYYTLGLSSTPQSRYFDTVLEPDLGPIIYKYLHASAVEDDVIVPFSMQQISIDFNAAELCDYAELSQQLTVLMAKLMNAHPYLRKLSGDSFFHELTILAESGDPLAIAYQTKLLERKELVLLAQSRMQCVGDLLQLLPISSRIIIFCERISQADELFLCLEKFFPHQLSKYHSEQAPEKNKEELRFFRDGNSRILISCKALDEGVDVPDADIAVVLSGSAQSRQRIQRLGRILRKNPDKTDACLFYLYIRQSSEEQCYLPLSSSGIEHYNYRYTPAGHCFSCPEYENLALELLERLKSGQVSSLQMREIRKCLNEGLTSTGWQKTPDYCLEKMTCSETIHERNYWRVMGWLCVLRQSVSRNKLLFLNAPEASQSDCGP